MACAILRLFYKLLVLQLRKARDFQRLAEQEKEGQAGKARGYGGPDGSGQWVSMGELGSTDLDLVLGGLGGGEISFTPAVVYHVAGAIMQHSSSEADIASAAMLLPVSCQIRPQDC